MEHEYKMKVNVYEKEFEDYPDQNRERHHEAHTEGLAAFVSKVAYKSSHSPEEAEAVIFGVLMELLKHFDSRIMGNALSRRLQDRLTEVRK